MKLRLFLFCSIAFAGVARAELVFKDPIQSFHCVPEDKAVEATYAFTNSGAEPVEIRRVKTSCGCTAASLDRKTVAPGESGAITAKFSFRGRRGPQRKIVWVTTGGKAESVLEMRVWIHEPLTIRPALVYWRVGDRPSTQRVSLTAADKQQIGIKSIASSDPNITAELSTKKAGGDYVLNVTAAKTSEPGAAELTIQTDSPPDAPRAYTVHVRIK